jgi:tetratricopeptide (TPR) repeat protein
MVNRYNRFVRVCFLYGSMVLIIGGCAVSASHTRKIEESKLTFQDAQQAFDEGKFQRAIDLWEQIPPSTPQYIDAQFGIHTARVQMEQIQQRETTRTRTLSQVETLIAQAEQFEQQGNFPEAVKKYEEARLLDPKNAVLHTKIEELHALIDNALERHVRLGEVYLAQGEYNKSKAEWEQLLLVDPTNEKAKQRLADLEVLTATSDTVFVKRGQALFEKGLINAAQAEFEKARRVNPANDQTLEYLATLEQVPFTEYPIQKGDTLSSIAEKYAGSYKILADFNGIQKNTRLKAGQVIKIPHVLGFKKTLDPGKKDIVLEIPTAEISTPAKSVEAQSFEKTDNKVLLAQTFQGGVTAFQEGKYREAVSLFEQVLIQDPENEEAYQYFMHASDNVRRGIADGESTSEPSAPGEQPKPEVQILLENGVASREAGEIKQAIATFEQAYQLAPDDPQIGKYLDETRDELRKLITAHLNEGIKQFNQDALKEAILEWDKVLELDPANRQAIGYKKRAQDMLNTLAP